MLKTVLWFALVSLGAQALNSPAVLFIPLDTESFIERAFPTQPDERLTPGELCDRADELRYPEKIAYCERHVGASLKAQVIREYDTRLGFQIRTMKRDDFKIDHYIPLCMGGANSQTNLWPQHRSLFGGTDILEQRLCELLAGGRIRQREAIERIKHAKEGPESAQAVLNELRR